MRIETNTKSVWNKYIYVGPIEINPYWERCIICVCSLLRGASFGVRDQRLFTALLLAPSKARNNNPVGGLDTCSIVHPTRSEVDSTTTCTSSSGDATLRRSHIENWAKRFNELVEYKKEYGHCLVPLNWKLNPALAHWVKRQRYQYRIMNEGKHSSMTPERLEALQALSFTWDSHSVAWLERWHELAEFKQWYGHPNVPKHYPENRQLAIWVKCQRRQYMLCASGQYSNMTPDRIERLNSLGFVFNPRSLS